MRLFHRKGADVVTGALITLKEVLNTLKSIDGTLKRIEQSLNAENQHVVIKDAISHAFIGDKYKPTPKDF